MIKIRSHLKKLNDLQFNGLPETRKLIRKKLSEGTTKFNIETKSKSIVFKNIETGKELKFISMREASLKLKISRNTINKFLKTGDVYENKSGIKFIISRPSTEVIAGGLVN